MFEILRGLWFQLICLIVVLVCFVRAVRRNRGEWKNAFFLVAGAIITIPLAVLFLQHIRSDAPTFALAPWWYLSTALVGAGLGGGVLWLENKVNRKSVEQKDIVSVVFVVAVILAVMGVVFVYQNIHFFPQRESLKEITAGQYDDLKGLAQNDAKAKQEIKKAIEDDGKISGYEYEMIWSAVHARSKLAESGIAKQQLLESLRR